MTLKFQASKFLSLLALVALVFGCSAKSPDSAATAQNATASAAPLGVANDSIPFPVYMGFSEFEPLLHVSNDTTYVINFWATWCKPCVAELPLFYEKLIPAVANQPVKVLLVSMDFPKDIQKKLIPFVAQRKLEKHVVSLADLDYNSWIDKVSTEWDGAIPFTLVYNKKNRVVKSGEMADYEELLLLLQSLN